jgi:hypothetical protein
MSPHHSDPMDLGDIAAAAHWLQTQLAGTGRGVRPPHDIDDACVQSA